MRTTAPTRLSKKLIVDGLIAFQWTEEIQGHNNDFWSLYTMLMKMRLAL